MNLGVCIEMTKAIKSESNESFEMISKKLRPIKAIVKVIGITLVFFGFLILVLSYALNYLIDDVSDPDALFLIVFSVGWLIFGGGLGLCFGVSIITLPNQDKISNYLDQYYKDKERPTTSIRFFSFRWSRLLAAILLLTLGFLDLFIITGAIGHHNPPYSTAVVLGGPSFYYLIGFFPQGFGIGLLLYVMFKSHKANIGDSENFFYYNEFNKNTFVNTAIPKDEIETISYQNNRLGSNHIWIIALIPFIVLGAINGVYLLRAPLLTDPTEGILFLVTSVLEVGALFYLTLRPAHYFKISTKENHYETWFTPYKKDLSDIPILENSHPKSSSEFMNEHDINPTHRSYSGLLIGTFFLTSGLIMLIFYYVIGIFGNLYTMSSIIFGTLLMVRAISNDFSDKNGVQVDYDTTMKTIRFEQTFHSRFTHIKTLQSTEARVMGQFRQINIFDIMLISPILIFSTIETVQSWAISSSSNVILNSVITTGFLALVYLLIFLYICTPLNHLRLSTPTLKLSIPVTSTKHEKHLFEGILSTDLKKSFLYRCLFLVIIGVSTLIGTLIYLNLYFFI